MMKIVKAVFGVVLLVAFLTACNFEQTEGPQENKDGETTAVFFPPAVEEAPVTISPLEPSPTPAVCTPLPAGMSLSLVPESEIVFTLELEGFEPGESLVFIFAGEAADGGAVLEERPAAQVGEDGRFTSYLFNLGNYAPITEWQGKIIHARGVACFDVTLPLVP